MTEQPTVLVVGANPAINSPLYKQLALALQLTHAIDADSVIDVTADSNAIDLIVLDTEGLGEKAYETCMWLKTDSETSVIPIMALGDEHLDNSRWLDAGVVDVISQHTPVELVVARLKTQLDLKHKTQLLASIASLDPLTTLASRQRLDEYFDIEWRRSLREYYPLSLLKIEIDHYVDFCDAYGIGVADGVLKRVGRSLSALCCRAGDMVSRYDTAEFVILLPSIELPQALALAEKMVLAVSDLAIPNSRSSHAGRVTISAGVATIEPSRDSRQQDLFDEAEEMLYLARQKGANQAQGIAL